MVITTVMIISNCITECLQLHRLQRPRHTSCQQQEPQPREKERHPPTVVVEEDAASMLLPPPAEVPSWTISRHPRLSQPACPPPPYHTLPTLPQREEDRDFYYWPRRPTRPRNGRSFVPMLFGRWRWNWHMPLPRRQVSPPEVPRLVRPVVVVTMMAALAATCQDSASMKMPSSNLRHCIIDFDRPILLLLLYHLSIRPLLLTVALVVVLDHPIQKWMMHTFVNKYTWPRPGCRCSNSVRHRQNMHLTLHRNKYRNGMFHNMETPLGHRTPVSRNENELLRPPPKGRVQQRNILCLRSPPLRTPLHP